MLSATVVNAAKRFPIVLGARAIEALTDPPPDSMPTAGRLTSDVAVPERMNTSATPFVSEGARLSLAELNTTVVPSSLIDGCDDSWLPTAPDAPLALLASAMAKGVIVR